MKIDEKLSASGGFAPDPLPLNPTGGCTPRPRYRLVLYTLAMICILSRQILDPPLLSGNESHLYWRSW